ncbi:MAG TPA: FHA domain-containing protein [Verrucomicrobiae bacterium]
MLRLDVTDDRGAVAAYEISEFPLVIGRSANAGLQIAAAGVFEEHACIQLAPARSGPGQRFTMEALGSALMSVNGEILPNKQLAVGDEISLGAARVTVSLAPAARKKLSAHELFVWTLLLLLVIFESAVIHFAR